MQFVRAEHAEPATSVDSLASVWARRLTWACFPLLAIAYFLVINSAMSPVVKLAPLELIYCTPIALTIVLSWAAYRVSVDVERRFWASLGLANLVLLACEVLLTVWVWAIDPIGPPRVSWPFHIMHAVAAVFFISLLLSMTRLARASAMTRWRWGLDSVALCLVGAVAITHLYTRPVMEPRGATTAEVLLGTGYPLFGLLMMLGTLANIVGFKIDRWRSWDRLVAISLSIYAVAISLWPMWFTTAEVTSRNYERNILDLVQFGGHWLLMAAAVYRLTEPSGWRIKALPPVTSRAPWLAVAVPAISVAAIPVILWAEYARGETSPWLGLYAGVTVALTSIVLIRSVLITMEHGVLFHRSITDPLTGVYNHRFFHEQLQTELESAQRFSEPLAVLILDITGFSRYNERHGHVAGDRLLVDVGRVLTDACRGRCSVYRLGADEFAVLAPETDATDARLMGERLVDVISIEAGEAPGTIKAAVGAAVFPEHSESAEELHRLADGALYHSRTSGRGGGVVVFDDDRVPDLNAEQRIDRLEKQTTVAAVRALAAAVDARDAALQEHSRRAALLARRVAQRMGLDDHVVHRVEDSALLHDVGRVIGAPAGPRRTGQHADDDPRHVIAGQQILISAGLSDLAPAARSHHEWWDGTGYPDGLAGREIPVGARIIAACVLYCELTGGSAQSTAMAPQRALSRLRELSGTRLDPSVVSALCDVVEGQLATATA